VRSGHFDAQSDAITGELCGHVLSVFSISATNKRLT